MELGLAKLRDAQCLAEMSRDLVEHGLGWSWTPVRIHKKIRCPNNVVLVARQAAQLVGVAVMYFDIEEARLNLLAVAKSYRRRGVGRRLVEWLEQSAVVAGITTVSLEVRAGHLDTHKFYQRLGYRQIEYLPDYYSGRESALRMARDLCNTVPSRTAR